MILSFEVTLTAARVDVHDKNNYDNNDKDNKNYDNDNNDNGDDNNYGPVAAFRTAVAAATSAVAAAPPEL